MSHTSPFGMQLRAWRKRRGLSQLDLALHAATTPRYVSFLETGRSRPGRPIILRLCDALDVPLRDRNAMLVAAGLTPTFPERPLNDAALAPVRRVIDHLLAHHEPFPAWVLGGQDTCLQANDAARRLFPWVEQLDPGQMLEMLTRPGALRDTIENWNEVAHIALRTLRARMLRRPDPAVSQLIERCDAMAEALGPGPDRWEVPVVCPIFRIDGTQVRTMATVIRFDTAVDVTVADLRVELMFPADDASEAFFLARASTSL